MLMLVSNSIQVDQNSTKLKKKYLIFVMSLKVLKRFISKLASSGKVLFRGHQ